MSDLISRQALKAKAHIFFGHSVVFESQIDVLPSADAVEVVRCMNCVYGDERIEDYRCSKLDEDWDIRFSPTHYCSFGERKEE